MRYDRSPRFSPPESEDPARGLRRLEDWAGRHDQWSAQTAVEGHEKVVNVEERVAVLEGKVIRLFALIGEHRLTWAIVAWVVGTAVAAGVAILARQWRPASRSTGHQRSAWGRRWLGSAAQEGQNLGAFDHGIHDHNSQHAATAECDLSRPLKRKDFRAPHATKPALPDCER